ncbi:MAG TPA: metallopeptidase TldD-related protein [Acidimicrobiales bacterium]|nr:metallopeptidase TldD-related protein [Acidimicrobiales bacterium]
MVTGPGRSSDVGGCGATDRLPPAAEVAERILAASRAAHCVAVVEEQSQVELRFANNTSTTNGWRRQRRVTAVSMVAVPGGMAVGAESRSGNPDIESLVRASEANAQGAPPADDAFDLVEPADAGAAASGGEDGFEEPAPVTEFSVLEQVLNGLAHAFERAREQKHVLAGFASHEIETAYLATSAGLRARHEQPTGSLELVARSADGSSSAWAGRGTETFGDVDLQTMHAELERRLAWAERRLELPAGRYETILPPDATADLMIFLYGDFSGRDAEDGRSVFSAQGGGTRLGHSIADAAFQLRSDPAEPGLECVPFVVTTSSGSDVSVFDNGLPIGPTSWIDAGRLERLFYHRAGARRAQAPVAPPVDNLVLELPGASGSLDDLVASTRRGLLLTCLWYIRTVDPSTALLTGLTRDGVYLVENGEVVGAVNNFRFNESPVELLCRVAEAGATRRAYARESGEWMSRTVMPPLRVADFNMSSVSPAT